MHECTESTLKSKTDKSYIQTNAGALGLRGVALGFHPPRRSLGVQDPLDNSSFFLLALERLGIDGVEVHRRQHQGRESERGGDALRHVF